MGDTMNPKTAAVTAEPWERPAMSPSSAYCCDSRGTDFHQVFRTSNEVDKGHGENSLTNYYYVI